MRWRKKEEPLDFLLQEEVKESGRRREQIRQTLYEIAGYESIPSDDAALEVVRRARERFSAGTQVTLFDKHMIITRIFLTSNLTELLVDMCYSVDGQIRCDTLPYSVLCQAKDIVKPTLE